MQRKASMAGNLAAALILLASTARAAIDLSGVYVSQVFFAQCTFTFAQSGTDLTITGPCTFGNTYTFDLAGTVDTLTGAFSATGEVMGLCETPGSVTMSGTGDGETFTATASCGSTTSGVVGTKCTNGTLDATEDCEDGNTVSGDCCSATCQFESTGSPCAADANACTQDVCNGAGTCQHPPDPSANGMPCTSDANACTLDVCDGAGVCQHPPDASANGLPCSADANGCTDDVCNASGQCTHPANTAACDDFNPCTDSDVCTAGACVGGSPLPECAGPIDLTGDWTLSGTTFLIGPIRHFEQSGVVLVTSAYGEPVEDQGWVNSASGEFQSLMRYHPGFIGNCLEVVEATAAPDGQSFTGERTFYCGLDGTYGPYAVTGQRCPFPGCLETCVPEGLSCTPADGAARLGVRATADGFPTRWRSKHTGVSFDLGDPTTSTDYRLCFETAAGGYGAVVSHGSAWRATAGGFRYKAKSGVVRRLLVNAGSSGVTLAASFIGPTLPGLPLSTPVSVRLVREGATPACFEATFASPTVNDDGRFRASE